MPEWPVGGDEDRPRDERGGEFVFPRPQERPDEYAPGEQAQHRLDASNQRLDAERESRRLAEAERERMAEEARAQLDELLPDDSAEVDPLAPEPATESPKRRRWKGAKARAVDAIRRRPASAEADAGLHPRMDQERLDRLMSYWDVVEPQDGKEAAQGRLDGLHDNPNAAKYQEALQGVIEQYGEKHVVDVAEAFRDALVENMRAHGMEPSEWSKSVSWAAWDLAKQRYYSQHPEETSSDYQIPEQGSEIGDPFAADETGLRKRREIANRQLGWEIAEKERGGPSLPGDWGDLDAKYGRRSTDVITYGQTNDKGQLRAYELAKLGEAASEHWAQGGRADAVRQPVPAVDTEPGEGEYEPWWGAGGDAEAVSHETGGDGHGDGGDGGHGEHGNAHAESADDGDHGGHGGGNGEHGGHDDHGEHGEHDEHGEHGHHTPEYELTRDAAAIYYLITHAEAGDSPGMYNLSPEAIKVALADLQEQGIIPEEAAHQLFDSKDLKAPGLSPRSHIPKKIRNTSRKPEQLDLYPITVPGHFDDMALVVRYDQKLAKDGQRAAGWLPGDKEWVARGIAVVRTKPEKPVDWRDSREQAFARARDKNNKPVMVPAFVQHEGQLTATKGLVEVVKDSKLMAAKVPVKDDAVELRQPPGDVPQLAPLPQVSTEENTRRLAEQVLATDPRRREASEAWDKITTPAQHREAERVAARARKLAVQQAQEAAAQASRTRAQTENEPPSDPGEIELVLGSDGIYAPKVSTEGTSSRTQRRDQAEREQSPASPRERVDSLEGLRQRRAARLAKREADAPATAPPVIEAEPSQPARQQFSEGVSPRTLRSDWDARSQGSDRPGERLDTLGALRARRADRLAQREGEGEPAQELPDSPAERPLEPRNVEQHSIDSANPYAQTFGELVDRVRARDSNFGVPSSRQLTDRQMNRLLGLASTPAEVDALQNELAMRQLNELEHQRGGGREVAAQRFDRYRRELDKRREALADEARERNRPVLETLPPNPLEAPTYRRERPNDEIGRRAAMNVDAPGRERVRRSASRAADSTAPREYSAMPIMPGYEMPPGETTEFSKLVQGTQEADPSFEIGRTGQLKIPQIRKLATEAKTLGELEALELEIATRDKLMLAETERTGRRTGAGFGIDGNNDLVGIGRTEKVIERMLRSRAEQIRQEQAEPAEVAPDVPAVEAAGPEQPELIIPPAPEESRSRKNRGGSRDRRAR